MADLHRQLLEKYAWNEACGLPRPPPGSDFGFRGAPQHGYGPEMWGIEHHQLKLLGEQHVVDDVWCSARIVVEKSIKPATAGKGMGYALLANKERPLRAKVMVSHAWDESYLRFVQALEQVEGPFWICFESIYQCGDGAGPSIAEQLSSDPSTGPFGTVLKSIKGTDGLMVAVITSMCNIYERMWCVYEMYEAMQLSLEVKVVQPLGRIGVFEPHLHPLMRFIKEGKVDSEKARCGPPGSPMNNDERAIRAKISQLPGGFAAIDRAVEELRLAPALEHAYLCARGMAFSQKQNWLERDADELQDIVARRLAGDAERPRCCTLM